MNELKRTVKCLLKRACHLTFKWMTMAIKLLGYVDFI